MEHYLNTLKKVYNANSHYLGKLNETALLDENNFSKWMSTFVVRRLKREYFTEDMRKIDIIGEENHKEANTQEHLAFLEKEGLVLFFNEYIVITELGVAVCLQYIQDNNLLVDYYELKKVGYKYISTGLSHLNYNKIDKLFPKGLSPKEIVFVVYLLLNGAINEENAFVLKETTSGFLYDIQPIIDSFKVIYKQLFDDEDIEDIIMKEKEFSNFMRRNTGNGKLGRVFNTYFLGIYQKSTMSRRVYFDLLTNDLNLYEHKLKEVLKILFDAIENLFERDTFSKRLRELTISYIVENPLLAHQQLLFFNNVEYRKFLYPIISLIDKEFT